MDVNLLRENAKKLVAGEKGILAADESNPSANKRFKAVGVEETEENRRQYRQLLFQTPGFEKYISGVILYDETFWQQNDEGVQFHTYLEQKGVMPGIKVDKGLIDLPGFEGENVTQGLDGLPERMENYAANGAKFAKWRSLLTIGEGRPSNEAIGANTYVLARYARICQEYNIVPIVEPELLFDGEHTIEQCDEAMRRIYDILFQTLRAFRVDLGGCILKTSMILPGKQTGEPNPEDVATRTSNALKEKVPAELGGVVFLSGGQTSDQAMRHLDLIEEKGPYPWGLTYSYSRALQDIVLKHWAHDPHDIAGAQKVFAHQLSLATKARKGTLEESDLTGDDFVTEGQN